MSYFACPVFVKTLRATSLPAPLNAFAEPANKKADLLIRQWGCEIPDTQISKSAKLRHACVSLKLSHSIDKTLIQHVFVPIGTILLFYGLIILYMKYLQFKKTFPTGKRQKYVFFWIVWCFGANIFAVFVVAFKPLPPPSPQEAVWKARHSALACTLCEAQVSLCLLARF